MRWFVITPALKSKSKAHVADDVLQRYPLQGGVFCFDPNVKGFAKHRFGG